MNACPIKEKRKFLQRYSANLEMYSVHRQNVQNTATHNIYRKEATCICARCASMSADLANFSFGNFVS